jgi:hypothetical protein
MVFIPVIFCGDAVEKRSVKSQRKEKYGRIRNGNPISTVTVLEKKKMK